MIAIFIPLASHLMFTKFLSYLDLATYGSIVKCRTSCRSCIDVKSSFQNEFNNIPEIILKRRLRIQKNGDFFSLSSIVLWNWGLLSCWLGRGIFVGFFMSNPLRNVCSLYRFQHDVLTIFFKRTGNERRKRKFHQIKAARTSRCTNLIYGKTLY